MKNDLAILQGVIIVADVNHGNPTIYHANLSAAECRDLMGKIIDALQVRIHELEERFPVKKE